MNDFLEKLSHLIKEKRKIRDTTLKTYIFNLTKLHKLMDLGNEVNSLDFLLNKKKVDKALENKKLSTKKTYYASIIVALMAEGNHDDIVEKYRKEMETMAENYKKIQEEQVKTETQAENWISLDKLKKVMNDYKKDIRQKGLCKKDNLDKKEMELIKKWLVANLYLNPDNPPMRLDYANMKIIKEADYKKLKDEDKNHNYLVVKSRNQKHFHFGDYKTKKQYGNKLIKVSSPLNSVINCWLKFNNTEYLLNNSKNEPMTENNLTKFLTKTFSPTGKNVSVNMLRHIFISDNFKPELQKKKDIADKMGHSTSQQELYIKKE